MGQKLCLMLMFALLVSSLPLAGMFASTAGWSPEVVSLNQTVSAGCPDNPIDKASAPKRLAENFNASFAPYAKVYRITVTPGKKYTLTVTHPLDGVYKNINITGVNPLTDYTYSIGNNSSGFVVFNQQPNKYGYLHFDNFSIATNSENHYLYIIATFEGPGKPIEFLLKDPAETDEQILKPVNGFTLGRTWETPTGLMNIPGEEEPQTQVPTTNDDHYYDEMHATDLAATVYNGKVHLVWVPSQESGVVGYNIYHATAPGGYGSLPVTDFPVVATSYDDGKAVGGNNYYIVKPVFSDGSEGRVTNEVLINFAGTSGAATGSSKKKIELQVGNPYMTADGTYIEIDPGKGTAPVMVEGRVLIPIRALVEKMGGSIAWDGNTQKISINARGTQIELWLNKNKISVNGQEKTIDVAPQSINQRTMVPVRFVIENLNCSVNWENSTKKVIIEY